MLPENSFPLLWRQIRPFLALPNRKNRNLVPCRRLIFPERSFQLQFRFQGLWYRVQGLGFRVWGWILGFGRCTYVEVNRIIIGI
jgi:hypothetical protein